MFLKLLQWRTLNVFRNKDEYQVSYVKISIFGCLITEVIFI